MNNEEPFPPWASDYAHGDYMQIGALLPTRDGRIIGNAYVYRIAFENNRQAAYIKTDAESNASSVVLLNRDGSAIMTREELIDLFHPPVWIKVFSDNKPPLVHPDKQQTATAIIWCLIITASVLFVGLASTLFN